MDGFKFLFLRMVTINAWRCRLLRSRHRCLSQCTASSDALFGVSFHVVTSRRDFPNVVRGFPFGCFVHVGRGSLKQIRLRVDRFFVKCSCPLSAAQKHLIDEWCGVFTVDILSQLCPHGSYAPFASFFCSMEVRRIPTFSLHHVLPVVHHAR